MSDGSAEAPASIDSTRLTRWFNAQARFYSLRRDTFDGGHVRWVAGRLDAERELRILDVACGTGLYTIGLAQRCRNWTVVGVDPAERMLEIGRGHARKRGLRNAAFALGDAERLGFADGTFDVLTVSGLLPVLNRPRTALAEFLRVLKAGGRAYIVERDRDALAVLDRLGFNTMVWGYRAVSTILPRYKFARGWNLERSTIDPARFESMVGDAGFRVATIQRAAKHLIAEGFKDS